MSRNLFHRLIAAISGPGDPTREFGDPKRVSLSWDFDKRQLNGIQFGDSIEDVAQFGRATCCSETIAGSAYSFTFEKSGLFLEFDRPTKLVPHYVFDYFGVLVGPDPASEAQGPIDYQALRVLPGETAWDQNTKRESLDQLFGPPYQIESDDEEDVRYHEFDGIEYEFEFNPNGGKLKRINIYPYI